VAPFMKTHSSLSIDNGYGDWAIECRVCHEPHYHYQLARYGEEALLFSAAVTQVTATTLSSTGAGWQVDEYAGLVLFPNLANRVISYRITGNSSDTLTLEGPMELDKASPGDTFGILYSKLIRDVIRTPNSGPKMVKFFRPTGPNSFADADQVFDGICQVCHTQTTHMRNDGSGPDQWHMNVGGAAELKCTEACHLHKNGFAHGGPGVSGGDATVCVRCHGHEAGTLYDPDATFPYTAGTQASQGRGTAAPHSTHTESSLGISPPSAGDDDQRGPGIYCSTCHDTASMPTFKSGTDLDGNGIITLNETDVCDDCHSPEGSYNGIDSVGESIGAKDNWKSGGVYEADGSLVAGKEKWCAGCHDEAAATITGIAAPNIVGDEDANTNYGIGYGFYKTGHGLATGTYPASGAPAANRGCTDCHDSTTAHIDGEARTYNAGNDNYQAGYRLAAVNGAAPMDIPRTDWDGIILNDFALCFKCHNSAPFVTQNDMGTNYRNDPTNVNAHWYHLNSGGPYTNRWDSDWDGVTGDSQISCPACHNVHGSPSPRMVRHGELISTPGTTDKVPSLGLQYTPINTYPTLAQSSGGKTRFITGGQGSIGKNGVCVMCHNDAIGYTRTPVDIYPPRIKAVYGESGSNRLIVSFTKGVYTNTGATGALSTVDFTLTDLDNGRAITAVNHSAGDAFAILSLNVPLDASEDVGTDRLAARSNAIFDAAGNAVSTASVVVLGDSIQPLISNLWPESSTADVALNSDLTFTLLDNGIGVDGASLSIQIVGNLGYAQTYSAADTGIMEKTGAPESYRVRINPSANFAAGEVIAVTINANDLAGNPLTAPAWSFIATTAGVWEQPAELVGSMNMGSPGHLIDGQISTGNDFGPGGPDHYADFKLNSAGDTYRINAVRLYGGPNYSSTWRLYFSLDGTNYSLAGSWSVGGVAQWYEFPMGVHQNAKYIRINDWHGGPESANAAYEFQFKGEPQ